LLWSYIINVLDVNLDGLIFLIVVYACAVGLIVLELSNLIYLRSISKLNNEIFTKEELNCP